MEAHVKNGSKREGQGIPPFYFPAPHISGPDIVFHVKINGSLYPVFIQLKLRQVLEGSDVEKALATINSNTIQGKMDKEHEKLVKDIAQEHKQANRELESSSRTGSTQPQQPPRLQDYCSTGVYVSMVITYPADAVLCLQWKKQEKDSKHVGSLAGSVYGPGPMDKSKVELLSENHFAQWFLI
ncbi:hypothetical protein BGZ96_009379 [Linnemannia gamsii]|uniref:FACT complex subunit n=1 Tax=Linnemannia gamsii TaxID=64522 RepID=A0ABQ7JWU7_9FUNG|nr:hypothetical protein BGZ96_009379 [Linnemannia gamsii]